MSSTAKQQEYPHEWELLGIEGDDLVSHTCDPAQGEHVIVERFTYLVNLSYDQTVMSLNSDKRRLYINLKNSVCVIPPGTEIVEYSSLENAEAMIFQCDLTALSCELGEASSSMLRKLKYGSDHVSLEMAELARAYRNACYADGRENSVLKSQLKAALDKLAIDIYLGRSSTHSVRPEKLSSARVKGVFDYIDSNIGKPIKLEEIASRAFLSPYHFTRAFKHSTGQSPHQAIIDARLSYLRKQLKSSELSLCELAFHTGFSSQSHMARTFKSKFGITPLAYKKLYEKTKVFIRRS